MSSTIAEEQAAAVQPPRRGEVIALGIDTTARAYDLTSLALAGITPDGDGVRRLETWLTMQSDGGDVYYHFSATNSAVLDNTAAIGAGGTIAYANTYGAKLKQDDRHEFRLNRAKDKFLVVKTSTGTATLRFWCSSNPGAT